MPKILSEAAIAQYKREGYYLPVRILDDGEVADYRRKLEVFEASQGHPIEGAQRSKSHLLFTWIDDLMRDDRILRCRRGPDRSRHPVLEHLLLDQGTPERNLRLVAPGPAATGASTSGDLVTRLARSFPGDAPKPAACASCPAATSATYCPTRDEYQQNNMLTRGQEISVVVDEDKAVAMPAAAGRNLAPQRPPRARLESQPVAGPPHRPVAPLHADQHPADRRANGTAPRSFAAATRYGHFKHTPRPGTDYDPVAVEFHEQGDQRRAGNPVQGRREGPSDALIPGGFGTPGAGEGCPTSLDRV